MRPQAPLSAVPVASRGISAPVVASSCAPLKPFFFFCQCRISSPFLFFSLRHLPVISHTPCGFVSASCDSPAPTSFTRGLLLCHGVRRNFSPAGTRGWGIPRRVAAPGWAPDASSNRRAPHPATIGPFVLCPLTQAPGKLF